MLIIREFLVQFLLGVGKRWFLIYRLILWLRLLLLRRLLVYKILSRFCVSNSYLGVSEIFRYEIKDVPFSKSWQFRLVYYRSILKQNLFQSDILLYLTSTNERKKITFIFRTTQSTARTINSKNSPIEINRKEPKRNITSYISSLFSLHYPFHGEARYQSDNFIRLRCTLSRHARAIHVIRAINPLEPHSRPFLGIRPPRSFIEVSLWKRVHSWTTTVVRQKAPSSLFSPLILLTVPPLVCRFARLVSSWDRKREEGARRKLVSVQCHRNTLSQPLFQLERSG